MNAMDSGTTPKAASMNNVASAGMGEVGTVGNINRNVSRCRTSIVPGTRTGIIGASSPFSPTAHPHVNLTKKVPIFGVFGSGLQAFREHRSFMFTQQ